MNKCPECGGEEFDITPVHCPGLIHPVREHICRSCGEEYTEYGAKPMLYTAQYRYSGKDRLDITVKGNDPIGKLFAPTWPMVQGVKNGTLTEEEYTRQYYNLLIQRWNTNQEGMLHLINMLKGEDTTSAAYLNRCQTEITNGSKFGHIPVTARDVTLVCFCPPDTFCHRHLLVKFLQHNWSVEYGGERTW